MDEDHVSTDTHHIHQFFEIKKIQRLPEIEMDNLRKIAAKWQEFKGQDNKELEGETLWKFSRTINLLHEESVREEGVLVKCALCNEQRELWEE